MEHELFGTCLSEEQLMATYHPYDLAKQSCWPTYVHFARVSGYTLLNMTYAPLKYTFQTRSL